MAKVLIVEDEKKLAALQHDYLTQSGFDTHQIHHGDDVLPWLQQHTADLILLDLMLPGKDGLTLCREIRQFSNVPIIMITARVEEIDRLLGLELGADDYICKPFSPREVVARVKTVLRRLPHQAQEVTSQGLQLDQDKHRVSLHGQEIELTAIEFNLLTLLAKSPGQIYSRQQLIDNIYQDHRIVSERTIDSHIKKLRRKFNVASPEQEYVQSVYGVGYKLEIGA